MVEGSLEACWLNYSSDDKNSNFYISGGSVVELPYLGFWGPKHVSGHISVPPPIFFHFNEKQCFWGPKCSNMEIRPQDPPKMENFDFFVITKIVSPIRFQQALNHYQVIILSRDISKNVYTGILWTVDHTLYAPDQKIGIVSSPGIKDSMG